MTGIHTDRVRAGSFGDDPERYDRTRPRYPEQLVDDLVGGERLNLLDVGCGTGIAAEAFAARGCDVLGVEPDPRMAAVAAAKGIAVEVATFEAWPARDRVFDLLISGQAWHWVDPELGYDKAASVLKPGGRLAVFWNLGRHDAAMQAALDEAYAQHAPHLLKDSVALGRMRADRDGDVASIHASEWFGEPQVSVYEWTETYTTSEWVDQLPTHSDHRTLEPSVLDALLGGVATAIDRCGGQLVLAYDTLLVTAVTRSS